MAMQDRQSGGIVFGDWMLVPLDDSNWELCHRHVTAETARTRRAGTAGEVRWHRLGRYYQWNTLPNAIRYAADVELKDECHGRVMELEDALHRYAAITTALAADVSAALGR